MAVGVDSYQRRSEEAADTIIGNLNEDGYLIASDEELLGVAAPSSPEADAALADNVVKDAAALGLGEIEEGSEEVPLPEASEDWAGAAEPTLDAVSADGAGKAVSRQPPRRR